MDRIELANNYAKEANQIMQTIAKGIKSYNPMGKMNDLALIMGIRPAKGVLINTPLGVYVFAKSRQPSKELCDEWENLYKEYDRLLKESARLSVSIIIDDNRTIGNIRYLEQCLKLQEENLTTSEEDKFLDKLTRFWLKNPSAECGIVKGENIEVLNF